METLINEILTDLTTELGLSDTTDIAVLRSKIKSATREVKMLRNYPSSFTEAQIIADLNNHYSIIRNVSLYDFNQVGAEGQTTHNEGGINRTWKSRSDCFIGLVAYCR